jgi:hypothetical protein
MATEQDYQRGVQRLSALPNEQRAIKTFAPLVSGLAQTEGRQALSGLQSGIERTRVNSALANARQDVRLANKDAGIALGVGAANLGLNTLSAHEQRAMARQSELEAQYTKDMLDAYRTMIKKYPGDIEQLLAGTHPTQQAAPTPEPAPGGYETYLGTLANPQAPNSGMTSGGYFAALGMGGVQ